MADNHIRITTRSAAQTRKLGHCLGRAIHQATVIALTGDLGSGKTAFVQGLAKGLNVSEKYYITSPTFTIINEYPGRLCLFHVDLYRIAHLAELEEIGLEEILKEDPDRAQELEELMQIKEKHRALMDKKLQQMRQESLRREKEEKERFESLRKKREQKEVLRKQQVI